MPVKFTAKILKFGSKGEKSGWTYIEIPSDVAQQLMPGNRKTFRVKGKIDGYSVKGVAVLPMGEGNFILPLNATMRKNLGKNYGAMVILNIDKDKNEPVLDKEMIRCLKDEPDAFDFFNKMSKSNQHYFSNWVASARTIETKAKRIAMTIDAMIRKIHFGYMLRKKKNKK
jgi:hypothetical protein